MPNIHVHRDGTVLLLKNIYRDVEAKQFDFTLVARGLTLTQPTALLSAMASQQKLSHIAMCIETLAIMKILMIDIRPEFLKGKCNRIESHVDAPLLNGV